jgi:hypothetical protein
MIEIAQLLADKLVRFLRVCGQGILSHFVRKKRDIFITDDFADEIPDKTNSIKMRLSLIADNGRTISVFEFVPSRAIGHLYIEMSELSGETTGWQFKRSGFAIHAPASVDRSIILLQMKAASCQPIRPTCRHRQTHLASCPCTDDRWTVTAAKESPHFARVLVGSGWVAGHARALWFTSSNIFQEPTNGNRQFCNFAEL